MHLSFPEFFLFVAVTTNGLLAGLFFSFACAIVPAFRRIDDRSYVKAFRAINSAIVNGWFLFPFFAAPLAAIASAVLHYWLGTSVPTYWLVLGAVCSVLTLAITAGINVPLNQNLGQATVVTEPQCRLARERFETRWNRWNLVRTVTSICAFISFAVAAVAG